jgi:prepilin-type N-terminal cleavage/methylation domain-containing protein
MKKLNTQKGFSLLELIIYIAIIGVFLVSVIQFTTTIIRAGEKAKVLNEVQQNARFAMERMKREIRTADGVNTGSSTFSSHPGVLSLEHDTPALDPTVFDLSSGTLQITQGAGSAIDLTSSKVEVSNFVLHDRSVSGRTRNIQIQLTVGWAGTTATPLDAEVSLQSSVVIREEED